MPRITTRIDRILRVVCSQHDCPAVYDYTGPKSASFAIVEAQALGWEQHPATSLLRCADHSNQPWITSVHQED